jgi:hypothetical protein
MFECQCLNNHAVHANFLMLFITTVTFLSFGTFCIFFREKARSLALSMSKYGIPMFIDGQRRYIQSRWYSLHLAVCGIVAYLAAALTIFAALHG